MNPPRCPVCKALLSADRVIEERWFPGERKAAAFWEYRYACPGCLSLLKHTLPEAESARVEGEARVTGAAGFARGAIVRGRTEVEISAARVSRRIQELAGSADIEELRARVGALRDDVAARVLLRVPELFAVARPAWGRTVHPAEELCCLFLEPPAGKARLSLRRRGGGDRARQDFLFLGPETALTVVGVEASAFLIDPAPIGPPADRIEALVAWPDLLAPAPSLP